jgi:hypothetical protein
LRTEAHLFDFDDTPIDSFQARVDTLEQLFNLTNISPGPDQFIRDLEGRQLKIELEKIEQDLKQNLGLFDKYRRCYWDKQLGSIMLYPSVVKSHLSANSTQNLISLDLNTLSSEVTSNGQR